jgi:hypothetical protein
MRHSFCHLTVSRRSDIFALWFPNEGKLLENLLSPFRVLSNFGEGFCLGVAQSAWDDCCSVVKIGVGVVFVLWCLSCIIPEQVPWLSMKRRSMAFLYVDSCRSALNRLVGLVSCVMVMILAVMSIQLWEWNQSGVIASKDAYCKRWYDTLYNQSLQSPLGAMCDNDFYSGSPWSVVGHPVKASNLSSIEKYPADSTSWGIMLSFSTLWSILVGVSALLAPFYNPPFRFFTYGAGPAFFVMLTGSFVQFRVFGGLTYQCVGTVNTCFLKHNWWPVIVNWSYLLVLITIPFYQNLHRPMHAYNNMSIRKAFFHHGERVTMGQIK